MPRPPLFTALRVYLRIGLLSFGGPAGQIALMRDELVTQRGWVSDEAFQRGLNVAMLLPGPEAQQLATWLGWRLHGLRGGLAAGLSFILPGAALMIGLAWLAAAYGNTPLITALFAGIQPAVIVIVARAVWGIAQRALKGPLHWCLAALAFVGIYAIGLPFPLIVALAALAGLFLPHADSAPSTPVAAPGYAHALKILMGGAALTGVVFALVWAVWGWQPYAGVAGLFTSAAFVSFGGAYALLPYVADHAVGTYGWLDAAQMLNGLALAESTPGPLILVNVYAGYFAGWGVGPWTGALTAALACFYTFVPSFALILACAPYVEALQQIKWARHALAGVSAAVVGVVLNLCVYLAEAALLPAGLEAPNWPGIALLVIFAVLSLLRPISMMGLVALGALSGLGMWLAISV